LNTAKTARKNMSERIIALKREGAHTIEIKGQKALDYKEAFSEHIQNDLNTPRCLADLWGSLKDEELSLDEKYSLALEFDQAFGLGLAALQVPKEEVINDPQALKLLKKRTEAKQAKDWTLADTIREELDALGYLVKDTASGPSLEKKM